jgi:hypothetical protein
LNEHPRLVARVDGAQVASLEPPASIHPRAWLLAVMAVQIRTVEGALRPILRVHVTGGAAATIIDLPPRARVDIGLGIVPVPVPVPVPMPDGIALHIDNEPVAAAPLTPRLPASRAFGHVFSRWLRDGGHESGCDLTAFVALPGGEAFPRLASRALSPPALVSYTISIT